MESSPGQRVLDPTRDLHPKGVSDVGEDERDQVCFVGTEACRQSVWDIAQLFDSSFDSGPDRLMTRETVIGATPALFATSRMVGMDRSSYLV